MKNLALAVLLFFATNIANASTVPTIFTPSDGDVNILNLELLGGGFNDGQFAALTQPLDLVGGVPQNPVLPLDFGTDNSLTIEAATLNLISLPSFSLAVFDGVDWHYESSITVFPSGNGAILRYLWDHGVEDFEHADLAVVDVSQATAVAAVPVPAAAWLFASGLLGMCSVARNNRKTSAALRA